MSWYSHYRGRSCGRMMHHLETYCGLRIADSFTYCGVNENGTGTLLYPLHGSPFATFTWDDDSDVASIEFFGNLHIKRDQAKEFMKQQFFKKPYLDSPSILSSQIGYIVQEIRKSLSFDDALFIRWVRKEHNSDFRYVGMNKQPEKIIKTVQTLIQEYGYGYIPVEDWKHFAMCAIYDILN